MELELSHPFRVVSILSAFDYHWDSEFQFLGESHVEWETVCVLDGQVEVAEDEKIYLLGPRDFICHGSMEFHRIHPHVLIMCFRHEGQLPAQLAEGVFHMSARELEDYQALFKEIRVLRHTQAADPYSRAGIGFALGGFLMQIVKKHPRSGSRCRDRSAEEYRQVVEAMQDAVRENLSLDALSLRTGIGLGTMKNLFRTYAGIGPGTYYDRLRGLEALRLLEGGLSIRRIADMLNYSSPNYFSSCFKKQIGITPGQWRKNVSLQ